MNIKEAVILNNRIEQMKRTRIFIINEKYFLLFTFRFSFADLCRLALLGKTFWTSLMVNGYSYWITKFHFLFDAEPLTFGKPHTKNAPSFYFEEQQLLIVLPYLLTKSEALRRKKGIKWTRCMVKTVLDVFSISGVIAVNLFLTKLWNFFSKIKKLYYCLVCFWIT